jgi:hypothetical protein
VESSDSRSSLEQLDDPRREPDHLLDRAQRVLGDRLAHDRAQLLLEQLVGRVHDLAASAGRVDRLRDLELVRRQREAALAAFF